LLPRNVGGARIDEIRPPVDAFATDTNYDRPHQALSNT